MTEHRVRRATRALSELDPPHLSRVASRPTGEVLDDLLADRIP